MKYLKTFLILVLTIILGTACFSSVGCEYGNDSSRVKGKTYGFYYMKVVGGGITAEYNVGDNLPYYGVTTEKFAMLDFYDDGTFKEVLQGVLDTGTWTQNGNKILVTYDNLPVGATSFNAEFTLNSNIITRTETGNDYNLGQVTTTVKYKLTETSFPTHFVSINSGMHNSSNSSTSSSVKSSISKMSWSYVMQGEDVFTYNTLGRITGLTEYGKTLSTIYVPSVLNDMRVTTIDSMAFASESFSAVYISSGILTIGEKAFYNCKNLKSVKCVSTKYILSRAFEGCNNLVELILNEELLSIDSYAFCNCTRLGEIIIPSSVEYINDGAFYGCYSLYKAKFVNVDNWYVSFVGSTEKINISSYLTNETTTANYLRSDYVNYIWKKIS